MALIKHRTINFKTLNPATSGDRTLAECFQLFDVIHRVTTDHGTVTRITREVVEDLAADNVIYAELRTTPKVRGLCLLVLDLVFGSP